MKQSRRMSLIEAVATIVVGYGIAVCAQIIIFPWFDIHISTGESMTIGLILTVVSLVRSYGLRRLFEELRHRKSSIK